MRPPLLLFIRFSCLQQAHNPFCYQYRAARAQRHGHQAFFTKREQQRHQKPRKCRPNTPARCGKNRGEGHCRQHGIRYVIQKRFDKGIFNLFAKNHQRQHTDKIGHARHNRQLQEKILHIRCAAPCSSRMGLSTAPSVAAATAQMIITKPVETRFNTGT